MANRPTRRAIAALLAAGALAAGAPAPPAGAQDARPARPRIAVTAIVDHASVGAMRQGIADGLRAAGLPPGEAVTLTFDSAEADLERAEAIARTLRQSDASLVIALSEPSARSVAAQPLRMPVVIAGLPIAAADAIAARRKARLLTGIASGDVHAGHVELIASIRPNAARVVVPHVRSDAAHQAMMRALVAAARTRPFTIEPYRIDEAGGGAAALPATLDPATSVVYLAAASAGDAADAVIEEAGRRGLPVVADRRDLVVRGATATLVHDSYSIGRQTGELAAAILHDASQARQPIHRAEARFLIVNGEAAADPRLKLAVDLAEVANEIIEWAQPDGPNPVVKPAPPPEGEVSSQ